MPSAAGRGGEGGVGVEGMLGMLGACQVAQGQTDPGRRAGPGRRADPGGQAGPAGWACSQRMRPQQQGQHRRPARPRSKPPPAAAAAGAAPLHRWRRLGAPTLEGIHCPHEVALSRPSAPHLPLLLLHHLQGSGTQAGGRGAGRGWSAGKPAASRRQARKQPADGARGANAARTPLGAQAPTALSAGRKRAPALGRHAAAPSRAGRSLRGE